MCYIPKVAEIDAEYETEELLGCSGSIRSCISIKVVNYQRRFFQKSVFWVFL